jgi:Rieske Fe-S protein
MTNMKIEESYLARRRFLCGMLSGGAAALGAGAALPLVSYLGDLRPQPPPPFLALAQSEWDLPPGTAKLLMYGWVPSLLIRTPSPEAALRIFVATCTHFDCIVGYREKENRIACACHGGFYDLDGQVTAGPPPRPLRPFHFRIKQGQLWIALEKDNLEKALREAEG